MDIAKWKKSIWEGYILYNSNFVSKLEKGNYGDSKKITGCRASEGRKVGGREDGRDEFLGPWHCSVYDYDGGFMSLYVYNTSQDWTLRYNTSSEL